MKYCNILSSLDGEYRSVKSICKRTGINYMTVKKELKVLLFNGKVKKKLKPQSQRAKAYYKKVYKETPPRIRR